MKRRVFLVASVFSLPWIGAYVFFKWDGNKEKKLNPPKLLSQLCDMKTIRMLGLAYLQRRPEESREEILLSGLLGDTSHGIVLKSRNISSPALEYEIEKRIKTDFDNGSIIVLKGWVLSVTEARQCAFYSILNS